jgi:hypothetical protein
MTNVILSSDEIKKFVYVAHVERSKMFHAIVKFFFIEAKNLIFRPITASQRFSATHY